MAAAVEKAKAARDGAPPEPQEGGAAAMGAASKLLAAPVKRCKKAVEFPAEPLAEAEALKAALEELKKERETAERLERERIEREAATEELKGAVAACTTSRDTTAMVKAIKRAKKAVDVDAALIGEAEGLKATCDEEKRAADAAAKAEASAAKAEASAKAKADADAAKAAKAEAAAAKAEAAEPAEPAAAPAAEAASDE